MVSTRGKGLVSVAQILHRVVMPAVVKARAPKAVRLRKAKDVRVTGTKETGQFEAEVFRFLVTYQRQLGLREVYRFRNQRIDGALVLTDGTRVALEMKYRLSWGTACMSNWEIEKFLGRHPRGRSHYRDGLVIFGEFSRDWARAPHGRAAGWDHWYRGHTRLHGRAIRIALVQFVKNDLLPYPRARSNEGAREN